MILLSGLRKFKNLKMRRHAANKYPLLQCTAPYMGLYDGLTTSRRIRRCYKQESHAVAGKPRDAAVNSDRYRVCWHFAGAISVSQMQSVSQCTVYA